MKNADREFRFSKSGISYKVYDYYKQFAVVNSLIGMMTGALLFNATYLKASNLTAAQVGLFSSLTSFVSMFAPMFWGIMSDRHQTIKKIIYICLSAMLVIYLPMPLLGRISIGAVTFSMLLIPIQAFFSSAPEAMAVSWVMQAQRKYHDIQFGVIRMFFTGAYALSTFLFMLLIEANTIHVIFIGYAVVAVITMLIFIKIPDITPINDSVRPSLRELHIERVFKNPMIIFYIVFMAFACIPASSISVFTPYLLEDIGAEPALLGGMMAIRSLSALPVLFFSNRVVRKLGSRNTLLLGVALYIVTQIVFVFCQTLAQAFINSVISGIAVGFVKPSEVNYVSDEAPEGLVATTQTICGAVYSIAGIICNLFGGIVVDRFGIRVFYSVVSVLMAVSMIFFYITTQVFRGKRRLMGKNNF